MVIVTRHTGLVEWLKRRGIEGLVVEHATRAVVDGQDAFGVLPLHLAARCNSLTTVDMQFLDKELKGEDLTPEQMDQAGAKLITYVIQQVAVGEVAENLFKSWEESA